ncbi:Fis family transcriptional regulator [Pseudonocardia asaccharolytica DSM 44247 = NBRC 16224]|uniref:Fis family transcriptional regulator n=2 Tax=Pseudonocardia asaccharolytica TaxID=54010 RepID=A0A511D405_9PSEU|nr:Fis family transcriptional regulator [Pseudonocardia asaccharolytica DSM 44247 = NBRC 16224]
MADTANRRLRIAAARANFLADGRCSEDVSEIVSASWRRSASAGVDAGSHEAPFHDDLDVSSRLVRCSQPVIDRISQETADIPLSIALTDGRARILSRSDSDPTIGSLLDRVSFAPGFGYAEGGVGTNGVGTVFGSGQPVHIVGPEHFHDRLQPFACTGAPIRNPLTGRIEGVLDISCLTEHWSALMHSLVRSAAHDIERNLLLDRSQRTQALFEMFVRLDARSRSAVVAVGGTAVMSNARTQSLFTPAEQLTIQEHARYLLTHRGEPLDLIELAPGRQVRLRGTRVIVGGETAGVVVQVGLVADGDVSAAMPGLADIADAERRASARTASTRGPIALDGESRSPLWVRACQGITAALGAHEALLVMGETGCGKFSLVTEVYHQVNPGGRTLVIDASDISLDSYGGAETAVQNMSLPTLLVFRNIDELSTDGVERLNSFLLTLADTDQPAYVAATLSDANLDSDLPFRDLLTHFQRAVTVPPLRHRSEDLPEIVARVLIGVADGRSVGVSPAAMRVISGYTWPRNIAQLEEALRSALLKRPVGEIKPEDLPGYCHHTARRRLSGIEAVERDAIVQALHAAGGNRVQAAAALGIARSSLYRKLKSFGITTI